MTQKTPLADGQEERDPRNLLASFKVVRKAPEKRGPWEFDDGRVRDDDGGGVRDDDGGVRDVYTIYIYIMYTIYIIYTIYIYMII